MTMSRERRTRSIGAGIVAVVAGLVAFAPLQAAAQDYPRRAVKIIVPNPAGGSADLMPRIVFDYLSRKWGQPVVIENKPGAAGNIAAEAVFNSEPDGYTLFSAPPPALVVNQNLYPRLGFDPAAFVPISVMSIVPTVLVASPRKIAATTIPDFIAYARSKPGEVTAANQGNGSTSHLTSAMFQMMATVKFIDVPYRGTAPALRGLLAGDCDIMFDNLASSLPLIKSGQLRLLGVATDQRMTMFPAVPAIAEVLPGFASAAWFAVVAPPKTPRDIVTRISADLAEAIRSPEIRKRFEDLSAQPVGSDPDATAAFMAKEVERWRTVIKTAGVRLE